MRHEKEIQKWLEELAGKNSRSCSGELYASIRFADDPLSLEMKGEVERRWQHGISPDRHRAAREACRVLQSLKEPRFYSANTNISHIPGKILKPDLVLEDEISGAFVIVEIKRSQKAAREFATELLAYANCLCSQHPGSKVFFVLVSTSWAPLEQHAIDQLALWDIPTLALEYREPNLVEMEQTLWVRSDLLPEVCRKTFPPAALEVHTKVFFLPRLWWNDSTWFRKIDHAAERIAREAERARASGFLVVWSIPMERSEHNQTRLFVSMAVRNPCRPQQFPEFNTVEEYEEFAWSNDFTELSDDTSIRLLLDLEVGEDTYSYSPELEGSWDDLRTRLERENANLWSFNSFGEIADKVHSWRNVSRYSLSPVIADITSYPSWHPVTWLPALESLIAREAFEGEKLKLWLALRRGEKLEKIGRSGLRRRWLNNFRWAVSQAEFACAWVEFIESNEGASAFNVNLFSPSDIFNRFEWESAINAAYHYMESEGELVAYCFYLGVQRERGRIDINHFRERREVLRRKGIHVPHWVEEIANSLVRQNF
ncbi:hypothetical protein [Pseudomonas sp. W4I3]|uniref:hypothetical protein n=1 Tax=Pseudomonas sp. W4I3 TaxID=3042294 RepID=UPI002781764D|nr:hypothetical protein [Pseudomonas sp. W4I3]MDQ0740399.1 hypothetical protein [Pseudomonas sp. W4I3]